MLNRIEPPFRSAQNAVDKGKSRYYRQKHCHISRHTFCEYQIGTEGIIISKKLFVKLCNALKHRVYLRRVRVGIRLCGKAKQGREQHRTDISDIQHTLVKVAFKCFHCPTPYGISTYISPVTQSTVT